MQGPLLPILHQYFYLLVYSSSIVLASIYVEIYFPCPPWLWTHAPKPSWYRTYFKTYVLILNVRFPASFSCCFKCSESATWFSYSLNFILDRRFWKSRLRVAKNRTVWDETAVVKSYNRADTNLILILVKQLLKRFLSLRFRRLFVVTQLTLLCNGCMWFVLQHGHTCHGVSYFSIISLPYRIVNYCPLLIRFWCETRARYYTKYAIEIITLCFFFVFFFICTALHRTLDIFFTRLLWPLFFVAIPFRELGRCGVKWWDTPHLLEVIELQ